MTRLLLISPQANMLLRNNDGHSIIDDIGDDLHVLTDRPSLEVLRSLFSGSIQAAPSRDFIDASKIFANIAEEHARRPFTGVGLIDEANMELGADVRARLGLPGIDPETANRFRDKTRMKDLLGAAGVRVPAYLHCVERQAVQTMLASHGKLVIKERKGFGSRGVTFVETMTAFDTWLAGQRRPQEFEIEEFISGPLYNVNAVVLEGRLAFVAVVFNQPGMADVDFSRGAPFVSHILPENDLHRRFHIYAERVLTTLGLQNGVMHLECFLTPGDEIVFCEVAARPGGGGVMRLIEAQFGLNMARASLQIEMGLREEVLATVRRRPEIACFIGFRNAVSGFVRSMPDASAFAHSWVDRVTFRKTVGDFAAPAAHCTDFVAHVDYHAADADSFVTRAEDLDTAFRDGFQLSQS